MQPDLTISIINHSNPHMVQDCIRSIYANTHTITFDIWVVDNSVTGEDIAPIRAEFPAVKWLVNKKKLGFAANHNQVLNVAKGRYSCILNDDTIIHDGAFDELVLFMDTHHEVGMVGAKLLNVDHSIQNCTFRFMTLLSELIDICFLPRSLSHLKTTGIDPAQLEDRVAFVDWVLGACIVVRDTALQQIGLLDNQLSPVANTEDVDWCFRVSKAGWKVAYCPTAVITHFGGQSIKTSTSGVNRYTVEMYRTRIAFMAKHFGPWRALMLRLIYVAALPWNAFMLTQSLLRRRLSFIEYKNYLRTNYLIACMSLFSPYRCFIRSHHTET